jgi:hypothetical protein
LWHCISQKETKILCPKTEEVTQQGYLRIYAKVNQTTLYTYVSYRIRFYLCKEHIIQTGVITRGIKSSVRKYVFMRKIDDQKTYIHTYVSYLSFLLKHRTFATYCPYFFTGTVITNVLYHSVSNHVEPNFTTSVIPTPSSNLLYIDRFPYPFQQSTSLFLHQQKQSFINDERRWRFSVQGFL